MQQALPESFVIFKPRDVVSGDFYWFTEQDDKMFIAAVDCTGHGVPGAFMSLIGNNLLDQAVHLKNLSCPAKILDYLHQEVEHSLKQRDGINKDGMDMALCVIDKDQRTLEFAGAKNPLIIIENGEITLVKGSRQPIGGDIHKRKRNPYEKLIFPISPNARYYLFSDGYQDQFGGEFGKKLTTKVFRQRLLECSDLPLEQQKEVHEKFLVEWMANEHQLDDILLIGFSCAVD